MKSDFRRTKIVCTVGPASENKIEELINAGMNVARINFSHGSYDEQEEKVLNILSIRKKLKKPIALLLDMQGPEIRTGRLKKDDEKVKLEEGNSFVLYNEDILGDENGVSVSYKGLYKDIKIYDKILLDDGAIELKVLSIQDKDIHCTVVNAGMLGNRKSINIPGASLKLPTLKDKDIQDLKDGIKAGFDFVAASFVRNKEDVLKVREVLNENGGNDIKLICKIENQEGIDNFDEILSVSDGIMIARGDLAVEVPFEQVPIIQKNLIKKCNDEGKIVITATQMLESMTNNPLPTRAEVSDVANAVFDLTGCIMLSGECAVGNYPVKCVETMDKIAISIEETLKYWKRFINKTFELEPKDIDKNIAYTTCITARDINADAIVAYTHTGHSVNIISGMNPECPILAVTDCERTYYQLALVWNVYPILIENAKNINKTIELGINKLKEDGILEKGETIILAGGASIIEENETNKYSINKTIGGVVKI